MSVFILPDNWDDIVKLDRLTDFYINILCCWLLLLLIYIRVELKLDMNLRYDFKLDLRFGTGEQLFILYNFIMFTFLVNYHERNIWQGEGHRPPSSYVTLETQQGDKFVLWSHWKTHIICPCFIFNNIFTPKKYIKKSKIYNLSFCMPNIIFWSGTKLMRDEIASLKNFLVSKAHTSYNKNFSIVHTGDSWAYGRIGPTVSFSHVLSCFKATFLL